jgi:hypothetical protein
MHSLRYYSVDEGGEQEDGTVKRLSIVGPADDFEAPEADALLTITGWTNHYPKVSTQSTPLVSGPSSPVPYSSTQDSRVLPGAFTSDAMVAFAQTTLAKNLS